MMELVEWTSHYIDYVNSFKRDLNSKNVFDKRIECDYKVKGSVVYLIREELKDEVLKETNEGNIIVVTLNKKENAKFMIEKWQDLKKNKSLKVLFSNPDVNMQWTIIPNLHDKFTDPAALKQGIKTLFESIPSV